MSTSFDLEKLRRELEVPVGFDRFEHAKRTEGLRQSFSHSIQCREMVDGSSCLTHALGLYNDQTYCAIAGDFFNRKIFAGKNFMEWLLAKGHLKEINRPVSGCLVLYFAEGTWQHAGTVAQGQRVVSKWGTFPLYEHALFEIPTSYGDVARYFAMPSLEEASELFRNFAKHHYGLTDEDIAAAAAYNA